MSKEKQIKYICDRCKQDLIVPSKIFNSIPSKWRIIEDKMLCSVCTEDFHILFIEFMRGIKL